MGTLPRLRAATVRTAVGIAALLLIAVAGGCTGDDPTPPTSTVTPTSEATASPSIDRVQLPPNCQPFASYLWASEPVRPSESSTVRFEAHRCAIEAIRSLPAAAQRLHVDFAPVAATGMPFGLELEPTDSGTSMLAWSGTVTFPGEGFWRGSLELAGYSEPDGLLVVHAQDDELLPPHAALPVSRPPLQLSLLGLDGTPETTTFSAEFSLGLGWLASPQRAVFAQQSEGELHVVAGDLSTGAVEPLVAIGGLPWIASSPDGSAVAILDRQSDAAPHLYVVDAETLTPTEVEIDDFGNVRVSWSPDGQTLLALTNSVRLISPDGAVRSMTQVSPRTDAVIEWAPDSRYAVVLVFGRQGDLHPLRIDTATGAVLELLDPAVPIRAPDAFLPVAISPDSQTIAVSWRRDPGRELEVALFDADALTPASLDDAVVLSYGAEPAFGALGAFTWTADGSHLLFTAHGINPPAATDPQPPSAVWSFDVAAGTADRFAIAPEGFYTSVHLGTNGRLLVDRAGCVQCDGGGSAIDIVDSATGQLLQTLDDARVIGELRPGFHLLSVGGTAAISDGDAPRLLPASALWGVLTGVTHSPDGLLAAVLTGAASDSDLVSLRSDGSDFMRHAPSPGSIPAAVLPDGGVLAQTSDGTSWMLTRPDQPVALLDWPRSGASSLPDVISVSPDGSRAAYLAEPDQYPFSYQLAIGSIEQRSAILTEHRVERTFTPPPDWSPDGRFVAHGEGDTLAIIDADTGVARQIDLAVAGVDVGSFETSDHLLALTWSTDGTAVDLVAGGALWRVPVDGAPAVRIADGPLPGGFLVHTQLARSPDSVQLAAATAFGVFLLESDGGWRRISHASSVGATLAWAPDGSAVAYFAPDSFTGREAGVIVAPVDGPGAYRLVEPGVAIAPLAWLPDMRIVFAIAPSLP